MSTIRAIIVGIAGALLADSAGWRAYVVTALIIVALLLTDWIAEEDAKKREKAFAARLLRGVRGDR